VPSTKFSLAHAGRRVRSHPCGRCIPT